MGTGRRETQTATPEHYPQEKQGFYNYLPEHSTVAAQPGMATQPPVPLGCMGYYQKQ